MKIMDCVTEKHVIYFCGLDRVRQERLRDAAKTGWLRGVTGGETPSLHRSMYCQLLLSFRSSESLRRSCCGKWGMMIMKIMMRTRRAKRGEGREGATGSICQQSRHPGDQPASGICNICGNTVAALFFSFFFRDEANAT